MVSNMNIHPITINETIHVRGKHLYTHDGTLFTVKGIAFPTPSESDGDKLRYDYNYSYNATSWIDTLKQLRVDLQLDFNTVQLHRVYPEKVNYHDFFTGAAELGIYIIVPLTPPPASNHNGVLDLDNIDLQETSIISAPKCYNATLFKYGATALRQYLQYPNIVAGIVANEVLDDEDSWHAAPCIRSYARDLKLYMDRMVDEDEDDQVLRTLPLMYNAAQDSSVSSVLGSGDEMKIKMNKNDVIKLTADYLTCGEMGKGTLVPDVGGNEPKHGLRHFEENRFGQSPIDIIGVNIESWCATGSYYPLHEALRNTTVPIVFSEMGCPHSQFDSRDDLEQTTKMGTRDWKQISTVMNEMEDSWSGFIARSGGPWTGVDDVLKPTQDFYKFKKELDKISDMTKPGMIQSEEDDFDQLVDDDDDKDYDSNKKLIPRRCSNVEAELLQCCGLRLFNDDMIQSYAKTVDVTIPPKKITPQHHAMLKPTATDTAGDREGTNNNHGWYSILIVPAFALFLVIRRCYSYKSNKAETDHNMCLQEDFLYDDEASSGIRSRNYGSI